MFNDKIISTLLDVIKYNRDIFSLLELGVEVAQIPLLLKHAQSKELIRRSEEGLSLTEQGENFLIEQSPLVRRRGMIVPKLEARIEKQDPVTVYLPPKMVHR
ncbi:hypothetical protein LJC09_00825 [Desulfovibrio sp. OttesenSCG-928-F20]|nr:hypothetical protein [Desulfovibrio sp. OttesenSCG-928-F20]